MVLIPHAKNAKKELVKSDSAVEVNNKSQVLRTQLRHRNKAASTKHTAIDDSAASTKHTAIDDSAASDDEADKEMKRGQEIQTLRYKLVDSAWRFTNFTFTSIIGLVLLYQEHEWMLNPELYFVGAPNFQPMSPLLKFFYQVCYASYIVGTWSVFMEPKQKDFIAMVVHHFTTLFLIHSSFMAGMYRIGAVILLLHEVSDPFMEIAKCFFYLNYKKLADLFFAMFAVVFMITRNFIFPYYVIGSIPKYCHHEDGTAIPNGKSWMRDSAFIGLCLLEVLHIYWAILILKMIKLALTNSGVQGDIRNEED